MGIPISELQTRIDSQEFSDYLISEIIDPPIGERLDWLISVLSQIVLGLGGSKTRLEGKVIQWDAIEVESEDAEELLIKYFEGMK